MRRLFKTTILTGLFVVVFSCLGIRTKAFDMQAGAGVVLDTSMSEEEYPERPPQFRKKPQSYAELQEDAEEPDRNSRIFNL